MNAQRHDIRHVVSDAPRVMVVDGSKLMRKLIGDVLAKSLPAATVTQAGSDRPPVRNSLDDRALAFMTKPTPTTTYQAGWS